jgi:uncharacterized peroxidase-related enzyme
MSYLRVVPLDERTYEPFALVKREFGFVPNFWKAQSARPDLIEAQMVWVKAILLEERALSRRQKEYVFLVSSAANLSTYCVTAHCEIIRMLGIQGPEPEEIAIDHENADLNEADRALLDYAKKLTLKPTKIGPEDVERLRGKGFSEDQILETVLMVGLAKFANVVAFGLGTIPDFENPRLRMPSGAAAARG